MSVNFKNQAADFKKNTEILNQYLLNLRIRGIEPISSAWKADNLPLIYIRLPSETLV